MCNFGRQRPCIQTLREYPIKLLPILSKTVCHLKLQLEVFLQPAAVHSGFLGRACGHAGAASQLVAGVPIMHLHAVAFSRLQSLRLLP